MEFENFEDFEEHIASQSDGKYQSMMFTIASNAVVTAAHRLVNIFGHCRQDPAVLLSAGGPPDLNGQCFSTHPPTASLANIFSMGHWITST
jgi:hypothetical protein